MNNRLVQILIIAVGVALGIGFLKGGLDMNAKSRELGKTCTEKVQGIVSGFYVSGQVYWDHDDDTPKEIDGRLYHPIFEYTVNNETYRQQSPTGKEEKRFAVDEIITIMYNPANPDEYYVPADTYAAKTGNLNIGFGIFMLALIGILLIVKLIKKS